MDKTISQTDYEIIYHIPTLSICQKWEFMYIFSHLFIKKLAYLNNLIIVAVYLSFCTGLEVIIKYDVFI